MALLAALPKAPSKYNPFTNANKALERRNWVLKRLFSEGFIDLSQYEEAINKELILKKKNKIFSRKASFFKEAIRREIIENYSEKKLYDQGLFIISSLDTEMQLLAEKVFQKGIRDFDNRKGWRGPLDHIEITKNWKIELAKLEKPKGKYNSNLALVLEIDDDSIRVGLENGNEY